MNEFGLKGSISDEDFMIHVPNNLPKEYDVILDGLENCIMASGHDALSMWFVKNWIANMKKSKAKKKKKVKKKRS